MISHERKRIVKVYIVHSLCLALFLIATIATGVEDAQTVNDPSPSRSEEYVYTNLIDSGYLGEALRTRYMAWRSAQSPSIDRTYLIKLYDSKRDSLIDGTCTFSQHYQDPSNSLNNHNTRIECCFLNNKIMRATEYNWYNTDVESTVNKSYDGKELKIYYDIDEIGEVRPFRGYEEFFDIFDPLSFAMLARQEDFGGRFFGWGDLVHILNVGGIVQESTEQIDGNDCLVVLFGAPASIIIYLDIEKDFSVRRIVMYFENQRAEGGAWAKPRVRHAWIDLTGLQHFGNGIWLPSTVDAVFCDTHGRKTSTIQTTLHNAAFNVGLSPELFDNIFPAGIMVTYTIKNIVYRNFGDLEDVQHYIDRNLFTLPEIEPDE